MSVRTLGVLALIILPLATPYGSLNSHPQAWRVHTSVEACVSRLGHAKGTEFMRCVVDELLQVQEAAMAG